MGSAPVPASRSWPPPAGSGDGSGDAQIRVLLAEDARVLRGTLAALLSLEPGIQVAAAVSSGDQIMPAAEQHRPDVALLDISLPGMDGLSAAAELGRRMPGCRVLILTGLETPGQLDAALRAGVAGFLLKDGPADELISAVRRVAAGQRVIDYRLAGQTPGTGRPGAGGG